MSYWPLSDPLGGRMFVQELLVDFDPDEFQPITTQLMCELEYEHKSYL